MQMLLKLDAESLHCAYGIFELDVLERKKGLLFKNLVRHFNSEEVEAREDCGLHFFKNYTEVIKNILKLEIKQKVNLC